MIYNYSSQFHQPANPKEFADNGSLIRWLISSPCARVNAHFERKKFSRLRVDANIIKRQNLTVLNSTSKCTGVITRERITVNGIEKSVIDFIIVSEDLLEEFENMLIDDRHLKYVESVETGFLQLKS